VPLAVRGFIASSSERKPSRAARSSSNLGSASNVVNQVFFQIWCWYHNANAATSGCSWPGTC
jgi:hypothetical protein